MTGRKLEGTDADGDEEDEEFRLAIQASLAEMEKIRPTAPGEEEELEFRVILGDGSVVQSYSLADNVAHLSAFADVRSFNTGSGDSLNFRSNDRSCCWVWRSGFEAVSTCSCAAFTSADVEW
jgi:hypothetical protein